MTLNELLLEWSYRSEKGYPDLDNPSDISILKQILEKLNLPSNTIIKNLKEGKLQNIDFKNSVERKDDILRSDIFLNKINKGEEFELTDGSKIIIDPDQSTESIQKLQNQDFKNLNFTDTSGNTYNLSKFEKTAEFGGGSGAGGGSKDTRIMESAHCYALAIAYYIKQGPINEDDLLGATSSEQFAQAQQYVDVDAELDEIEEFFDRKEDWYLSIVKATNKIYELFPNKEYKIHRNSDLIDTLYKIYNKSFEKDDEQSIQYPKMKDDKWNPADIWLINDNVNPEEFSGNLAVLNGQLADWYEDGDMIGISLKKIGKKDDAAEKIYNDPDIDSEKYEYEGYRSLPTNANSEIIFTGGKATARMFSTTKNFNVEVSGKAAQGGKAGMEAINTILERNGLNVLPPNQEVIDAFNNNDENYYNKLYYLYDRFIDNISKEDFEQKYNSAKPAWIIGKFYSLSLIEKLEDNKPEPTNEIVDDILRYAFSSTRDSSKFIKIS